MIAVKPALIIAGGARAKEIIAWVKSEIVSRNRVPDVALPTMEQLKAELDASPDGLTDISQFPVFQFIHLNEGQLKEVEILTNAYALTRTQPAIRRTEETLRFKVDASGVEAFVIFRLQREECEEAIRIAGKLKECESEEVSITRNAIFLVSRKLLSLKSRSLQLALRKLDKAMQSDDFPFHRCFFVDEVNEQGQTMTKPEELTKLVARFVALTVASEFSVEIKKLAPFYKGKGTGEHYQAYGSFACSTIGFDGARFADKLSNRLAEDISVFLLRDAMKDFRQDESVQEGIRWSVTKADVMKQQIKQIPFKELLDKDVFRQIERQLDDRDLNVDDPSSDHDYQQVEKELDAIAAQVLQTRECNLNEYAQFLDQCLEQDLVTIESLSSKTKEIKKEIADLLIKIMCKIKPHGTFIGVSPPPPQRTYPFRIHGIILMIVGVVFAGLELFGILNISGNMDFLVIGVILIVGAILFSYSPKVRLPRPPEPVPIPWEKILKLKQLRYKQFSKLVTIFLAVYKRLDWAAINIKRLEEKLLGPQESEEQLVEEVEQKSKPLDERALPEKQVTLNQEKNPSERKETSEYAKAT